MLFGINKRRVKLSTRLSRVYAAMFAVVLVLLSSAVFWTAYRFLLDKQYDNITNMAQLASDHIVEEFHEGDPLDGREILEEGISRPNVNLYLMNMAGEVINRIVNFYFDFNADDFFSASPRMAGFADHQLLLYCEQDVVDDGHDLGKLYVVMNLQNELNFLQLLGTLLLVANIVGWIFALFAGRHTSEHMLAPINRMINDANLIGSQILDARLEVPEADDELRSLALTINGMLARIERAFCMQGRFVADASHELRTPLAILQGNVDMLERWGRKDEAVLEGSIHTIQNQTVYMSKLVQNLLFLARADGQKCEVKKESISIRSLFDELLEEQEMLDHEHTYAVQCDASVTVEGDRSMVRQLLRILIDNSMKYTPEGGSITLFARSNANGVALTVRDTGIGMNEEHLAHIFERFYRVDKARSRSTGGMGLGLSIAEAIITAHGGSISAESVPGDGTAVTAVFPN